MRTTTMLLIAALGGCAHESRIDDTKQRYDEMSRELAATENEPHCEPMLASECNASALACHGVDEALRGNQREALRLYEASLACEFRADVARRAFYAACESRDAARARVHFQEMAVDADKRGLYREACVSYGVDPVE